MGPSRNGSSRLVLAVVVVVATAMAMIVPPAHSKETVSKLCKDENYYRVECMNATKGAAKWDDAVKNTVDTMIKTTDEIEKLLPEVYTYFNTILTPSDLEVRKSKIEICNGQFQEQKTRLNETLKALAVRAPNLGNLMFLSGASWFSECEQFFDGNFPPTHPPGFSQLFWQMEAYCSIIRKLETKMP